MREARPNLVAEVQKTWEAYLADGGGPPPRSQKARARAKASASAAAAAGEEAAAANAAMAASGAGAVPGEDGVPEEAPAGAKGLAGFLDSLSLRDRDEDERDPGGVTLATVHASKGLEFANVYVAGLEEGAFPHGRSVDDHSLEEERRLFYVAITRAKDHLTLTRSVIRTVRGKEIRTVPSRYIADFPAELVDERDLTKPAAPEAIVDHLARMRAALGR